MFMKWYKSQCQRLEGERKAAVPALRYPEVRQTKGTEENKEDILLRGINRKQSLCNAFRNSGYCLIHQICLSNSYI